MKTSIYLSNQSISAVTGTASAKCFKVAACLRRQIPWGLVHNGTVADGDRLAPLLDEFLRDAKIPRKSLSLVIDGDSVSGRALTVPPAGKRALLAIIRNQLGASAASSGTVCDYSVVDREAGRIYAVLAERKLVAAFTGLFGAVGASLKSIDISQSCAMRLFRRAPRFAGKTFIFSVLDGPDIISMLFTDNEYSFSDRSQLTEGRGTPAAAVEISRVLSSMVQYTYAQSSLAPLTDIYISGLMGEEIQFYGDIAGSLNNTERLNITVGPMPPADIIEAPVGPPFDYGQFVFCLGDLIK